MSSKKVLLDMGSPFSKEVQLVSFHTVSKGYWTARRGGYFEMTNIPPRVVEEIYKVASIAFSPNVSAQIFMGLMVSPPKPGDILYDQFARESKGILESLRRRAKIVTDGFNSCKTVVCQRNKAIKAVQFRDFDTVLDDSCVSQMLIAMYSFPQIRLPAGALQAAKQAGKVPDVFYCLWLCIWTERRCVPSEDTSRRRDARDHG
ncbi:PREDICTED: glutamate--glyoxylate aminotransferase 1-like [Camelina sativa]|uniref:Glutamate--glyoxylate aminotransferase 1-like n=1 Tax=Camelina sativa TaxID=90675 RepID=A0ABM0XT67_CAMSA|nr:PREDICTED: glutamate--glyoxylate aminotransferase 1-like [Camelina sativa]